MKHKVKYYSSSRALWLGGKRITQDEIQDMIVFGDDFITMPDPHKKEEILQNIVMANEWEKFQELSLGERKWATSMTRELLQRGITLAERIEELE